MAFQEIYVIEKEENPTPLFIGYEQECRTWNEAQSNNSHSVTRLDNYIRKFIRNEKALTKTLQEIFLLVKDNPEKKQNTDLHICNFIRSGHHNLGGQSNLKNLCNAVFSVNKPVIIFCEAYRQARSQKIKGNLESFSPNKDSRFSSRNNKYHF